MCLWSFLGKIHRLHGITKRDRSHLKKVKAILEVSSPKTVKEVQKLTRLIANLNRFVFKATDECEAAFQELKRYLRNPPLLSLSKEGENLFVYLAVSTIAVSETLI